MPVGKPKNLTGRGKTKGSPGPTQPYPKATTGEARRVQRGHRQRPRQEGQEVTKIRKTSTSRVQDRRPPPPPGVNQNLGRGMYPTGKTLPPKIAPKATPGPTRGRDASGSIKNPKGLDYKPVGGKSGGGRWVTTKPGPHGPAGTTVGRSVTEDATIRKMRKRTGPR